MLGTGPHPAHEEHGCFDEASTEATGTVTCAAAVVAQISQPDFRYWIDEILWSQGRLATVTIEEVLNHMGGQRTGGPSKQVQKPQPAAEDPSMQHLLHHLKISDQHQQLRKQSSVLSGGQPAVSGTTPRVSRSSSEATMHSSRTSSDSSLDMHAAAVSDASTATGQLGPAGPLRPSTSANLNSGHSSGHLYVTQTSHLQPPSDNNSSSEELSSQSAAAEGRGGDGTSSNSSTISSPLAATKRPDDHLLGYHHVRQWDLLWTKSVYAVRAARQLRQGQVVSAIAGLNCLSMKKRMVQTLRMALGSQAFKIVPLSFCIPEDLPAWQAWLASPQGSARDTGLWMLKTGQDAGRGLKLVHTQQALQVASRPPKSPSKPQTHIKVAQQYITRPLLIQGRKFHLRLWLLVTSHRPLRAYLHSQGLVLFSSETYDARRPVDGPGVRPSVSHVTNYARNEDTWVWDLGQMQQHLGQQQWQELWLKMKSSSALTAAAVLGPLRTAHRWLQPSISNYGFQMLGLDYLVDESMNPWLLEVNSAPSIMAVHSHHDTCALIKSTKQAMLGDMMAMVQHRLRGSSDGSSKPSRLSWQQEFAAEMANSGGFEPVMGLFPVPGSSGSSSGSSSTGGGGGGGGGGSSNSSSSRGFNIPWQDVDLQLQQLLRQQHR